ncbi:hypothetical protein CSX04_08217 [Burkholderia cepacia]|nr:hypothetical protein CSX04_08217 [Burkholderia cepacia]
MKKALFCRRLAAGAFVLFSAAAASASDAFPTKPVHIVVATAPGAWQTPSPACWRQSWDRAWDSR